MDKLTDLEICKRIAEIEGHVVLDSERLASRQHDKFKDETKNTCYIDDGRYGNRYNPLTDDALIFTLAFNKKAKVDYFDECVYITTPRTLSRHRFDKDDIASLRKAICLAVIEAHNA